MASLYQILKRPIVTEKTTILRDALNQYVFEVDPKANKVQIRRAVEMAFDVRVADVRTSIVRGRQRRTRQGIGQAPNWKKAVVTLYAGQEIDLYSGL